METFASECSTNLNDIVTFFDAVKITKAHTVCDYGLLLCQNGMISRQVDSFSLPADLLLDGVNPWNSVLPPLYEALYDHIYSPSTIPDTHYDLGIMLNQGAFLKDSFALIPSISVYQCRFLVVKDDLPSRFPALRDLIDSIPMHIDNDLYYLLITGKH